MKLGPEVLYVFVRLLFTCPNSCTNLQEECSKSEYSRLVIAANLLYGVRFFHT